jgi:uncharacterized protein DUF3775
MLTISLERLSDLLEKAAAVELALPLPADDEEGGPFAEEEIVGEDDLDDDAYRDLLQSLAALPREEQQELMALALLARSDVGSDEWESMLEQAGSQLGENPSDELARILLVTDEIETALDRLGIDSEDLEEDTEEGETEEDE